MGVIGVVVLLKTLAHSLTLGTLLTVSMMMKLMCYKEEIILLVEQTIFVFVFVFKTLDMHVKIKPFKCNCGSVYGSKLWSLADFCCS